MRPIPEKIFLNLEGKPISEVIRALVACFRKYAGATPQQINEGSCFHFARLLKRLIPECKVIWCDDWDHGYVRFRGRLYDSETPNGVKKYTQLPAIRRQRER